MPAAIPTKTAGSLGEALTDTRTPVANELSAVHLERLKSLAIEIATEIGATGAPASGSILDRLDDLEVGAPLHNFSAGTLPTVDDDEGDGYSVGSIWIWPGTGALVCLDATAGAALWAVISNEDLPTPGSGIASVGRANSAGSGDSYARANHVHDGGPIAVATKASDFTLLPTDEVVLISTAAGPVICGPDGASITSARSWVLKKTTTDTDTISVQPPSGHSIEGGAVDAPLVLPDSDATDFPAWTLIYQGGSSWWLA